MSPRSTVRLRDPDEEIPIADDESWVGFFIQPGTVTLFGKTTASTRSIRSIPWWRVVSIDSTDVPVPAETRNG